MYLHSLLLETSFKEDSPRRSTVDSTTVRSSDLRRQGGNNPSDNQSFSTAKVVVLSRNRDACRNGSSGLEVKCETYEPWNIPLMLSSTLRICLKIYRRHGKTIIDLELLVGLGRGGGERCPIKLSPELFHFAILEHVIMQVVDAAAPETLARLSPEPGRSDEQRKPKKLQKKIDTKKINESKNQSK